MQLCWEICIRWHKKLRMLATKSEQLFIDLKVDEQQKGNMEHGVFKPSVWLSITKTLNEKTGKGFSPKQVKDKHNRLRQKWRKWGQLLRHTGLGWDATTQTVAASDEAWANVIAICYIYYPNFLYICL